MRLYTKKQTSVMDLLQFTIKIAERLAFSGYYVTAPKRGRPKSVTISPRNSPVPKRHHRPNKVPVDDIIFDDIVHWPEH